MFIYWKGSEAAGDRLPWGDGIVVIIIIINILFFQRGPSHPPPQPPPLSEHWLSAGRNLNLPLSFLPPHPPEVPLPPAFWLPPLCAWMVRLVGQESTEQRRWWWRWWRRRSSSSKLQLDSVAAKCVWVYFCSTDRRRLVSLWPGSLSGTWKRINLAEVTLRAELSFWFRFTLASRFRLCVSLRFYMKLIKYETFVFPFYSHYEGPTNTKFLLAI